MVRNMLQRFLSLGAICVAGAAAATAGQPAPAAEAAPPPAEAKPIPALQDITGRWTGRFHARRASCSGDDCNMMTIDMARCGAAWCGVVVPKEGGCGDTALRLEGPRKDGNSEAVFTGSLRLAPGSEPYTVRVSGVEGNGGETASLWLLGDTGGDLRMFRRSFPLEAHMTRQGEPACKGEPKTS